MRWLFCRIANVPNELIFTVSPSIKLSEISSSTDFRSSSHSVCGRPVSWRRVATILALVIVFVVTAYPVVAGEATARVAQKKGLGITRTHAP